MHPIVSVSSAIVQHDGTCVLTPALAAKIVTILVFFSTGITAWRDSLLVC